MTDMQETVTRTGGSLIQSTLTTKTDKAGVRVATSQPGCSLLGVLKSEQIELWSLRAARVMAVFVPAPVTIINLLVLLSADINGGAQLLAVGATVRVFITVDSIFIVVLGDTFAAGEFSTGSIRPSLGAIPNRGLPAVAGIMVLALSMLILPILAVGISVVLGLIVLPTRGTEQSLGSLTVRMTVGLCPYLMSMGLFSFCIGFLSRSSVGTISVTLGILQILSSVVRMLGDDEMAQTIMVRLSGIVNSQALALGPVSLTGGVWGDLAILAANVVVMSVIAVGQFKRLDV